MSARRWLWWLYGWTLVILVLVAGGQLRRWQPALHATTQLAILLVLTKALADLLELPLQAKRPTFYYEDYFAGWLHYGILAAVAAAGHALAGGIIDRQLTTGPLALGTYLIWRLTSPPR